MDTYSLLSFGLAYNNLILILIYYKVIKKKRQLIKVKKYNYFLKIKGIFKIPLKKDLNRNYIYKVIINFIYSF